MSMRLIFDFLVLNDITYSDSFLHVITLFGYLLTVHDT